MSGELSESMALKLFPIPFPIFAPQLTNPPPYPAATPNPNLNHGSSTEVRFSRWNNAHAEKFNRRQRAQQEIEDDIRRYRRFNAATNITDKYDPTRTSSQSETFKSVGTPSSPSSPSIPGKKSKYSKPENFHPAFRRVSKISRKPQPGTTQRAIDRNAEIKISDDGVSFAVNGAPFEFKYSYTETPKMKPLKLRETFTPFAPTTMSRPWTGRAPRPESKKKLQEFDSFVLPPPDKKGVKPVQSPGPYLPGTGPRYAKTREEILGEPLTREEVKQLVDSCLKSKRQLNMGRDGFTHNMMDNIHAHWKRKRVCKIKCKGVCTVDMDNVCQQLEERTGGKIIFRQGGVLYLFRGRNYNYKTRPRFPLMLWKPVTPVYPRLIKQVPEGLTLEEARAMRKKGRVLTPICKLGKNGVYCDLVENVKEAFEACELVRINCQGMNASDYRKIGAKLRDLVPCVLISFEHEHILMWRGRNWKSSIANDYEGTGESNADSATSIGPSQEDEEIEMLSVEDPSLSSAEQMEDLSTVGVNELSLTINASSSSSKVYTSKNVPDITGSSTLNDSETMSNMFSSEMVLDNTGPVNEVQSTTLVGSDTMLGQIGSTEKLPEVSQELHGFSEPAKLCVAEGVPQLDDMHGSEGSLDKNEIPVATLVGPETTLGRVGNMEEQNVSEGSHDFNRPTKLSLLEVVMQLRKEAVESGDAVVLDDADLDADTVYQKAVAFAESAPPSPVFGQQPTKAVVEGHEKQERGDLEVKELTSELAALPKKEGHERRNPKRSYKFRRTKEFDERYLDKVPQGRLGVDELAKLLA